jgi:hypothetical protein
VHYKLSTFFFRHVWFWACMLMFHAVAYSYFVDFLRRVPKCKSWLVLSAYVSKCSVFVHSVHCLNKISTFWLGLGGGFGIPTAVVLVKHTAYCLTCQCLAVTDPTAANSGFNSCYLYWILYLQTGLKKYYICPFFLEYKSFFFIKRAESNLFHR